MNSIVVSSAVDRIAVAVAVVLSVSALVLGIVTAAYLSNGRWEMLLYGALVLILGLQAIAWWQASSARVQVGPHQIRRLGVLGWSVSGDQIDHVEIRDVRGRPYLLVSSPTFKARPMSAFAVPGLARRTAAAPLAPDSVDKIREALKRCSAA